MEFARIPAAHGPLQDVLRWLERPARGAVYNSGGRLSDVAWAGSATRARSMRAWSSTARTTGWLRWSNAAAVWTGMGEAPKASTIGSEGLPPAASTAACGAGVGRARNMSATDLVAFG